MDMEEQITATRSTSVKCLNRDAIKAIAMFTMLLNHIGNIFLTTGSVLCEAFISIGYFTAITMIYFLVEGYSYTRSKGAYLRRLLLFALLSEVPYCLAFTTGGVLSFYGLDMLFTLSICFALIWLTDICRSRVVRVLLAVAAVLLSTICDWAVLAPVYTLFFMWARGSEGRKRLAFAAATLLFGLVNLLGGMGHFPLAQNLLFALMAMTGMGLSGVCILFLYNGKKSEKGGTFSKWFFYAFYPLHLLILGLIRVLLMKSA